MLLFATLPKQSSDGTSGVLRVNGYVLSLPPMSGPQIEFMVAEALRTCRWMPSPAELIAIAERWNRSDADVLAKAKAQSMVRREHEERLDTARRALRAGTLSQEAIDALPDRHKQILETQGLLRLLPDDGGYVARSADPVLEVDHDADTPLARMAAKFGSAR